LQSFPPKWSKIERQKLHILITSKNENVPEIFSILQHNMLEEWRIARTHRAIFVSFLGGQFFVGREPRGEITIIFGNSNI